MPRTMLDTMDSNKKRSSSCPQRAYSLRDIDLQAVVMQLYNDHRLYIRAQASIDEVLNFPGRTKAIPTEEAAFELRLKMREGS